MIIHCEWQKKTDDFPIMLKQWNDFLKGINNSEPQFKQSNKFESLYQFIWGRFEQL